MFSEIDETKYYFKQLMAVFVLRTEEETLTNKHGYLL